MSRSEDFWNINFRKYLFEPATIPVVRCRCPWFVFKISIHFGPTEEWNSAAVTRPAHGEVFTGVASVKLCKHKNNPKWKHLSREYTWPNNMCWNTCKENKNWKTHPSPSHGAFRPVFASLVGPFRFFFIVALVQKFTVILSNQNLKNTIWVLYAQLKTSLANDSLFTFATLLSEGFRSSLGCAWVLLPGFIGFCWILGGTSKQQNPPPCPFRLGSKTVHGFTFKFRPVIVPLCWINKTCLLISFRFISTWYQ